MNGSSWQSMQSGFDLGTFKANGSNDKPDSLEGVISESFFRSKTEPVSSEPQVEEVEMVEQSAIDDRRI